MKRDTIISRGIGLYGDKYDYSLIRDCNTRDDIEVICKEHGLFRKRLSRFLSGSGCPKCSGKVRLTKEEFIEKARKVHGDKYDYSKVEYVNAHTRVCIICLEHGEFWQTPTNHLNGNGCPKCKLEKLSKLFSSNIEEFSKKGTIVHNGKYTYKMSDYVNNSTPLLITCPIHGEFWQLPHNHLQGKGCPKCNESKLEKELIDIFDKEKIEYIYQWHLPWAKKYSLDFLIPKINIGIECQGIQHFEDGHFKNTTLEETIKRDEYKSNTCKENGIDIIYFSNVENGISISDKNDIVKLIRVLGYE